MFGLGLGSEGFLKIFARKCEFFLMKRFDVISTISYSMMKNAKEKGIDEDKILFFPNWSDTAFVTPDVNGDKIKEELGLSGYEKIVLYSGNIGQKQGLEGFVEAAASFINNPSVHFLIIGSGSYRSELEKLANQQQLTNITFLDLQPWERVPEILAMADVHLVVQKKGAADAVLPSKLTNILSAGGHALVTAEENTELGLLANKHPGIFTLVEPENSSAFTQSLECMLNSSLRGTNQVARDYALNNLAKDEVINRFIKDLHDICAVEAKQDKETIG
jgi:colanic acid biosynthesis glycosyl transferase WcaI